MARTAILFALLAWSPAFAQTICHDPPAGLSCPGDRLVWCNTPSLIYHFQGERYFGCTRTGKYQRQARSQARQHVVCRVSKSFDAHGQPAYDATCERLFEKGSEPHAYDGDLFHALQFRQASSAGVTTRLWEMADIVDVLETWETSAGD